MIAAMREDVSVDAPPALIALALRLFRPHMQETAPSLLQRADAPQGDADDQALGSIFETVEDDDENADEVNWDDDDDGVDDVAPAPFSEVTAPTPVNNDDASAPAIPALPITPEQEDADDDDHAEVAAPAPAPVVAPPPPAANDDDDSGNDAGSNDDDHHDDNGDDDDGGDNDSGNDDDSDDGGNSGDDD